MVATLLIQAWDVLVERASVLLDTLGRTGLELLLALVVLVVGWIVASLLATLIRTVLRAAHFNEAVRGMFGDSGPALRHEPAMMASWVLRWSILVIALLLAADVMGYQLGQAVSDRLRELLPRLVSAAIVLVFGFVVAMLLGALTRRVFASGGFAGSQLRGQIVTGVLTAVAVLLSLEQLGFAAQFILTLSLTAFAAVALAIGLAFGLGCRELARDFVIEYLRSLENEAEPRA